MLKDVIPAKYRRFVYALYALAATVVGALNVAEVNTGKAVDVIAYLGIAVGAVAAGNTGSSRDEDGVSDFGLLVAVVVVLLGLVLILGR